MARHESSVPIVLWLCAAAVVHYASYQGAGAAAEVGIGRIDLRSFVAAVSSTVGGGSGDALEVTFQAIEEKPPEQQPEPPKPDADQKPDPDAKPDPSLKPPEQKTDKAKPKPVEKKEEPKKEEPKKEEPKKPPPPKLTLPPMTAVPPPPPPPPPEEKKQVAVDQHVEDKAQKDNPNAEFKGEHANHVKDQTQARITNHQVNDTETKAGASKASTAAGKDPGNSDKHKIADAQDVEGTQKRAPGEASTKDHASEAKTPGKTNGDAKPAAKTDLPPSEKAGEDGKSGPKIAKDPARTVSPPVPATEAKAPPPSPDTLQGDKGTYSVSPFAKADAKPAGSAQAATPGRAGSDTKSEKPYTIPKWGGGAGPDGTKFNLSPGGALAAIGEGTIKKERSADGERRRSEHRGPWKPSGLDRIKQQIENYVATVKLGNTTALNTAAVPFAKYLHHVHNRLHPLFADEFLDSLDSLPGDHALNQQGLRTILEVALDKEDGKIMKMGITRTSGVTAFDIAALDAMDRAGPFGKPPEAILSPDGRVYLHWEFHRKREVACMTANARPYILANPPDPSGPSKVPLPGPRVPEGPQEKGAPPPSREGKKDGDKTDGAPG